MSPDLDKKLVESFPNLYSDRDADMRVTAMCWGFPGDGWYKLLHEASTKLEKLILALPKEERQHYRASQVKEKYGTLCFYMTSQTEAMDEAIRAAEEASSRTCEVCGEPGVLRGPGWYHTSCDLHSRGDTSV